MIHCQIELFYEHLPILFCWSKHWGYSFSCEMVVYLSLGLNELIAQLVSDVSFPLQLDMQNVYVIHVDFRVKYRYEFTTW